MPSTVAAEPRGIVTGTIFNDLDLDGFRDAGEAGLRGRIVYADLNNNGILDDGDVSDRTSATGVYQLRVPVGTWDIQVVDKRGFDDTSWANDDVHYDWDATRYRWVEIGTPGNQMVLSDLDDGAAFLELTQPFTFYGQAYTDVSISSNGFITFGTTGTGVFGNTQLPSGTAPNTMIAPAWDDFDLTSGGGVYAVYDAANARTIIEWKDVPHFGDTTGQTSSFQIILNDDGTIKYQYKAMAAINSVTVGVENADGTDATQIAFGPSPTPGSAFLLTPYTGQIGVASVAVAKGGTFQVDFGQAAAVSAAPADSAFGTDHAITAAGLHHDAIVMVADMLVV